MPLPLLVAAGSLGAIVATVIRFLVGYAIMRFITVFGVTIVTFTATDYVGNQIRASINSAIGSLPSQFVEVFSDLGGFECINIVFSAWIAALTLRTLLRGANRLAFGS